MKLTLTRDKNGDVYSKELNALAHAEGYEIEGIEATLIPKHGNARPVKVGYPLPSSLVIKDDIGLSEWFFLGEVWLTINEARQIDQLIVIYDQTAQAAKIFHRVDH